MRLVIGSDHHGADLHSALVKELSDRGFRVKEANSPSHNEADYPFVAASVAENLIAGAAERGVLVCRSGIGMAIVANKYPGVYAAVCHDVASAQMSIQSNGCNVIAFGSSFVDAVTATKILEAWCAERITRARSRRKLKMVYDIEKKQLGRTIVERMNARISMG